MSTSQAQPQDETSASSSRSPIHNPFPASLSSECKKASQILDSFVNPSYNGLEGGVPRKILGPAKGLVICSVFKLGFLGSGRFGSGLIVCRLPDGGWSAPSAVSLGGLGAGGQFGMEFTNFVFVLTTNEALETFMESSTLTLGGNLSIAFGTGRSGETGAIVGTKGLASMYAYSKTRGVFGGLTFEGGVLFERPSANKKIYGRKLKAKDLLSGEVPFPPEAESLMRILSSEVFQPARDASDVQSPPSNIPARESDSAEVAIPASGSDPAAAESPVRSQDLAENTEGNTQS